MRLVGRIIVIFFALVLASIAAGIAIAFGLLGPAWHGFAGDVGERIVFWGAAFYGATFTGAIGLLPLAILIAIAEGFKIRSLLSNVLAGAAMLAFGYYTSALPNRYEESIDRPPPPISRAGEIAVAAGAVFGLTYWLIAGRNAGRWREG
jgi:hypothetical protein